MPLNYDVTIIDVGKGFYFPEDEDVCSVRVTLASNTQLNDETLSGSTGTLTLQLGDCDSDVEELVHDSLMQLKEGGALKITATAEESSERLVSWLHTCCDIDLSRLVVGSVLEAEFQLRTNTKAKRPWQKTIEERLSYADYNREKGNECFKAGQLRFSLRRYRRAIKCLVPILSMDDEDTIQRVSNARLSCYLNSAMCNLKLNRFVDVVAHTTKALACEPYNAKAFYRRGVSYIELNEFDKAKSDLDSVLALEPGNCAVREQLQRLDAKIRRHDVKVANVMKKYLESSS